MEYLDLSNCNFYKDNFLHVLPKVNTIWLYDFFSYCRNYRKAWTQILNLIVNIKVYKDEVLWEEVKEEDFKRIIEIINKLWFTDLFQIERVWEDESSIIYKTTLWFFILFNILHWIESDFLLNHIISELFSWFYVIVKPQKTVWKKLLNTLFSEDMNQNGYTLKEFQRVQESKIIYEHLFLYNTLKTHWEDVIYLWVSDLIHKPLMSVDKEIYFKETYDDFNNEITKKYNIKVPNTIWDYFKFDANKDPLLILWYIAFNEFILWKHTILCGENSYLKDLVIVNEVNILDVLHYCSQVFCLSFINKIGIYTEEIESIEVVKKLRNQFDIWKDIKEDKGRESELLKELDLIRKKTDSSVIEIEIKKKNIQSSRARFHVNDISRIQEMKDFVRDNWWVHIQNYKWSKSHIEWDRFKFFWDKKSKKSWNW